MKIRPSTTLVHWVLGTGAAVLCRPSFGWHLLVKRTRVKVDLLVKCTRVELVGKIDARLRLKIAQVTQRHRPVCKRRLSNLLVKRFNRAAPPCWVIAKQRVHS